MENLLDRITINNSVCNGKPTIRNKRITVNSILEFLSVGESIESILAFAQQLHIDVNALPYKISTF